MATYRPVMDEERVGDGVKPMERVAFVDADRFLAQVAARCDHREAELPKEEVMEELDTAVLMGRATA